MLMSAASLLPIFGSGVDIGAEMGGISLSSGDIGAPSLGTGAAAAGGVGMAAPADRLPRINSINLSAGTLIDSTP
jgi:hypothetical protein